MIRLTRTLVAGLIATAGVLPRWTHLPLPGVGLLGAQQPAKVHSSDADSDDTMDKDDGSDSDDDNDTPSHDEHGAHAGGGHRTLDVARMLRGASDTTPLQVHVAYGAGALSVLPVDGPWLYNVRLNYLPGRESPRIAYDPNARSLNVSGSKNGDVDIEFGDHHNHSADDLRVALARKVPLDLDLAFGAADATAKLGGLSVRHLTIQTGAADATVSFNAPDPVPLEQLDLKVGAASFEAKGLGNAHVQHVNVQGVASDVDLDFGGHWTGDATLDLQAALGAVHIHVPQGVAVDMPTRPKTLIGSWDNSAGPAVPEPGSPVYHLHIRSKAALGSVEVDRKTTE